MAEHDTDDEDHRLRAAALQNAGATLQTRERAERALAAERERLRITLASIGDAVITTDATGRVEYLNGVAEALTGWPQAAAAGRPLPDVFHIVHETTRRPAENPALRALREGVVVALANHTVLIARDGTERPIDDSAAPMRDEAGTPIGAVLVFRDVTERRRAEEAQGWLAAIVESSDDAVVSKTLDGVIRSWNAGAERIFGYPAAEAVGRPITLIIPAERLDEERDIIARLRAGERVDHFETVRVARDGRLVDISLTVSPLRDAAGRVVGASKVARDITERKRAEAALRASEERYRRAAGAAVEAAAANAKAAVGNAKFRAFFEQGTNFAGVLDLAGTVVEANRLCLDACGFTRDQVLGRPFWECGWWSPSPAVAETVRAATLQAAAGRAFRTETPYFFADGSERVVDLFLAPVTDDFGRVLFVAATGTDVTERRRMEDALREANRRKDEFLATLAHELRNPLAPLRNAAAVLRLAPPPDAAAKLVAMMDRQLAHLTHLVDDLLDVSRVTTGKVQLRLGRVDLREVVEAAVETCRPAVDAAGHELTVGLPPAPLEVDGDGTRLTQVLTNLLTNAAKYTPDGGRIAVTAERAGADAVIRVTDTGVGIPADMLPKVFEVFTQVGRSADRAQGGLGLGLALVKTLAEMHGGTAWAESPGPDRGSTFVVRLPLAGGPGLRLGSS